MQTTRAPRPQQGNGSQRSLGLIPKGGFSDYLGYSGRLSSGRTGHDEARDSSLTPLSVAGVHRRAYRRAYRGAVYGATAYGVGSYYGAYGYPSYSYGSYNYGYPSYSYGTYSY